MKRLLLLTLLLLPLAASAGTAAPRKATKTRITSVISEARRQDGAEVVRLGRIGTAAIRGVVRAAAREDPEAREALALLRGIRNLTVLQYDGCAPAVRERIARRLDEALDGNDLLMEAKDGNSAMRMYGIVDEQTDQVRDFVIHAPADCALICIFGSIPMEALGKLAADD